METNLLQFILPEELLEYLELTDAQKTNESYTVDLYEKNNHPKEYTKNYNLMGSLMKKQFEIFHFEAKRVI